ncbi:MAG: hypothetical protein LIP28_04165, partial [Deltaproteobacteria bacterium]|nr:hypothetical protein [Deltaproteobacteria bacterium]
MSTTPEAPGCCRYAPSGSKPAEPCEAAKGWNVKYLAAMAVLVALWWLAYSFILPASHWLVFGLVGLEPDSRLGLSLEFFLYD